MIAAALGDLSKRRDEAWLALMGRWRLMWQCSAITEKIRADSITALAAIAAELNERRVRTAAPGMQDCHAGAEGGALSRAPRPRFPGRRGRGGNQGPTRTARRHFVRAI